MTDDSRDLLIEEAAFGDYTLEVYKEFVQLGILTPNTPPLFLREGILAYIGKLRLENESLRAVITNLQTHPSQQNQCQATPKDLQQMTGMPSLDVPS